MKTHVTVLWVLSTLQIFRDAVTGSSPSNLSFELMTWEKIKNKSIHFNVFSLIRHIKISADDISLIRYVNMGLFSHLHIWTWRCFHLFGCCRVIVSKQGEQRTSLSSRKKCLARGPCKKVCWLLNLCTASLARRGPPSMNRVKSKQTLLSDVTSHDRNVDEM